MALASKCSIRPSLMVYRCLLVACVLTIGFWGGLGYSKLTDFPIPGESTCFECDGRGRVLYLLGHPYVTDCGLVPGNYMCPACNGEGRLYDESAQS
jgi:hypothetical protein